MKYLFLLLSLLLCSATSAQTRITWRFSDPGTNPNISQLEYRTGVRQGFEMYERYFNVDFIEKGSGRTNIYIVMWISPLPGRATALTDVTGHFGYRIPGIIYINPTHLLQDRSLMRVIIAHEYMHWMTRSGYHSSNPKDIFHGQVHKGMKNWTRNDWNLIRRYIQPRKNIPPWTDNPPWLPKPPAVFPWTNPKNQYDVDNNNRITARDALLIINAVGTKVDIHKKPKHFYDVSGDRKVTSVDAIQVLNRIQR